MSVYYDYPYELQTSIENAGYDLKSKDDYTVKSNQRLLVKTDLFIDMPSNMYAQIAPRSGLALKNWVDVKGGVIDSGYRGEVGVILHNYHPTEDFQIKKGDRIAQLLFLPILHPTLEKKDKTEHSKSVRDTGGFGSTGV